MGRWISIYFSKQELEKLEKVLEKESQRRGKRVSAYEILKEWILEKLNQVN